MPSKKAFSKEELDLLNQYKKETTASPAVSGLYSGMGLLTAMVPIFLYHFVLHAELESNFIMYGIVSIVSGLILSAAHSNVAAKLKIRIESEVEKPMQKKIAKQYAGKKTDKEIAEISRKRVQEISSRQAAATAIFQNNAVFLLGVITMVFHMCHNLSASVSYLCSVSSSAGLVMLLSTGK